MPWSALQDETLQLRDVLFVGHFSTRVLRQQNAIFSTTAMGIACNKTASSRQSRFVKSWALLKNASRPLYAVKGPKKLHERGRRFTLNDSIERLDSRFHPLKPESKKLLLGGIYEWAHRVAPNSRLTLWSLSEVGGEVFVWVKIPRVLVETIDYVRRVLEDPRVTRARERHVESAKELTVLTKPDFEAILAERPTVDDATKWVADQERKFEAITDPRCEFSRCNRFMHPLVEVCREAREHVGFRGKPAKTADAHAMHIAEAVARFCPCPTERKRFAKMYAANFYRSVLKYAAKNHPESCSDLTLAEVKRKSLAGLAYERDYHGADNRPLAERLADPSLTSQRVQLIVRHLLPKTNARISRIRDRGALIRRKRSVVDGKTVVVDTYTGQRTMSEELCEGEFLLFQEAANQIFEEDNQPALTVHDALFVPEEVPDERVIEVLQRIWESRYPHMPDLVIKIE